MSEFNKAAPVLEVDGSAATNADNNDDEEVEVVDNRILEEREEERRKLTSPNEIIDKDFVVRYRVHLLLLLLEKNKFWLSDFFYISMLAGNTGNLN